MIYSEHAQRANSEENKNSNEGITENHNSHSYEGKENKYILINQQFGHPVIKHYGVDKYDLNTIIPSRLIAPPACWPAQRPPPKVAPTMLVLTDQGGGGGWVGATGKHL